MFIYFLNFFKNMLGSLSTYPLSGSKYKTDCLTLRLTFFDKIEQTIFTVQTLLRNAGKRLIFHYGTIGKLDCLFNVLHEE